jgi:uncharacterized membrane protein YebE (DUF533 family)
VTASTRTVAYGSASLLIVAGALAAVLIGDGLGAVVGMVLIGVGLVAAVSLVFYEVGLSEDRERARDAAERAPSARPPRPARRLDRMRGRPRRLH